MNLILPSIAVVMLTAIDQFTKYLAKTNLMGNADVSFIKGILSFSYHTNEGMAFGLFQGGRWFFLIMAILILGFMGYYYKSLGDDKLSKLTKMCLVLICSGAVGNSIDRLLNGYVVDFIKTDFMNFPIFNVADMYVVVGSISVVIIMLFFVKEEREAK